MIRFFFLIIGFTLAVFGGISILAYLNLLTTGYKFMMYLSFVLGRIEFYIFIIGITIILLANIYPRLLGKKRKK